MTEEIWFRVLVKHQKLSFGINCLHFRCRIRLDLEHSFYLILSAREEWPLLRDLFQFGWPLDNHQHNCLRTCPPSSFLISKDSLPGKREMDLNKGTSTTICLESSFQNQYFLLFPNLYNLCNWQTMHLVEYMCDLLNL